MLMQYLLEACEYTQKNPGFVILLTGNVFAIGIEFNGKRMTMGVNIELLEYAEVNLLILTMDAMKIGVGYRIN